MVAMSVLDSWENPSGVSLIRWPLRLSSTLWRSAIWDGLPTSRGTDIQAGSVNADWTFYCLAERSTTAVSVVRAKVLSRGVFVKSCASVMAVTHHRLDSANPVMKLTFLSDMHLSRAFEVLVSGLSLLLLSPLMIFVGLSILVSAGPPILYRAERVGRGGRTFLLYKFRTMVGNARGGGGALTVEGDVRITRIGRILRRSKMDELPQLINVLRGEMCFVGPRPEDPRYVALYSDAQLKVLDVKPGITSPASLRYKNEAALLHADNWEQEYVERILPDKLSLELDYLARRSFWTDLSLIFRTISGIVR